ncbi:MAG: hypothetical protein NVSMB13_01030 [Mycobacteriales bacterium]
MTGQKDSLSAGGLLLIAALTAAAVAGELLWLLSGIGTLVTGHGWQPLPADQVLRTLTRLPGHLADLGTAFPAATSRVLPPSAVLWPLLLLVLSTHLALALFGLRVAAGRGPLSARPTDAPAGAGLAGRREIRQHLGERAVRARAAQTRPSLQGRFATSEVGLALGRDLRTHRTIWGSVEDSYLYLGPPRSGKGVHLVVPQALDAAGALLVTSTRPDTLHATAEHRANRGPVLAFDPQQLAPDAPRLRWSPTRGCGDPLVAINRARALAAGAQANKSAAGSDGDFWTQMTSAVLRAYLHAAALTGRPISDVLLWASRPADPTPMRILRTESAAAGGWAEELAAQAGADPRQRDSVWAGVRRAVDSLADPRVLATCSPDSEEAFDPAAFLASHGTLYLLGSTGTQLSVAPLITALLDDVLDTARTLAATSPGGRLDPPLLLLLDEAANIAPLPTLPNLLADGGGVGITTVAVLQSLAQARARWGEAGADAMWDAATTKVVLGGLAHAEDLQRISRLAGDVDRPLITRSTSASGNTRSVSSQRLPALPIEQLRCLPAGQALVLARRAAPVQVQLTPWWQHPSQSRGHEGNRPA